MSGAAPLSVLEDLPISADDVGEPEDHARAREAGATALRTWSSATDQHPARIRRTIERAWEDTLSEVIATLSQDRSYGTAFVRNPTNSGPAWSVAFGRYTVRFAPRTDRLVHDGLFVRDDRGVASTLALDVEYSSERNPKNLQRFAHHLSMAATHRPFQDAARALVSAMVDASVRALGHPGMLHLRADTVSYAQGTAARMTEHPEDRAFPWAYWCWVSARTIAREVR